MNDLEERLRQLEPGEPPLGFDPDDVVTLAGKRQRSRRAVTLTGAGVVVAGALVGGLTLVHPTPGELSPAAASGVVKILPADGLPAAEQRAVTRLAELLPQVLPTAKVITVRGEQPTTEPGAYSVVVSFLDAAGLPHTVALGAGDRLPPLGLACKPPAPFPGHPELVQVHPTGPDGKPLRCDKLPQPGGSTVVVSESGSVELPTVGHRGVIDRITGRNAVDYRQDGSTVTLTDTGGATAQQAKELGVTDPQPFRQESPALADAQLITLVTDPAFTAG